MKVFGISADNDEWPEDKCSVVVLVAAPDKDTATELFRADTDYKNCHSINDVEVISTLTANVEEPQILTDFHS